MKTLISPCNSIRQFDSLSMPLKNVEKNIPNNNRTEKFLLCRQSTAIEFEQLMIGNGEEPWMCRKREEEIYWKIVDGFVYGSRNSESKLSPTPIFGLLYGTIKNIR